MADRSEAGDTSPRRRLPAKSGPNHRRSSGQGCRRRAPGHSGSRRLARLARCRNWRPASSHGSKSSPCSRTPSSSTCAIASLSGFGSGPLERLMAPSRRLRVGATDPVAGSNWPSCRIWIRSPKRSSRSRSLIAAAERIRAPDAGPATSPTASHSLWASDEVGSSRKPRPPTDCHASPDKSRRRETRSGKASASALPRSAPMGDLWGALTRRLQLCAICRAAWARGERSPCHLRHRDSRSGSLPPRPRSVMSKATSAAAGAKPRSRASISMCARRGSRGSAAIARPWSVTRPPASIAPRAESRFRASSIAVAGGGSRKGRARGSASPHRRQVRIKLERSASRISGGSCAGSDAIAASSHRRIAIPGDCRAARPARCVTEARLARSVTSLVRPAPRS